MCVWQSLPPSSSLYRTTASVLAPALLLSSYLPSDGTVWMGLRKACNLVNLGWGRQKLWIDGMGNGKKRKDISKGAICEAWQGS